MDALSKFNPNHYPAGSPRGGQFAPKRGFALTGKDAKEADFQYRAWTKNPRGTGLTSQQYVAAAAVHRSIFVPMRRIGQDFEDALFGYAEEGYIRMKENPYGEEARAIHTSFARAFQHPLAVLRTDATLYRGERHKSTAILDKLKAGTVVRWRDAPLSFTTAQGIAEAFGSADFKKTASVVWHVKARKGQRAFGIDNFSELEVLLPARTRLRVLSVGRRRGKNGRTAYTINAELL